VVSHCGRIGGPTSFLLPQPQLIWRQLSLPEWIETDDFKISLRPSAAELIWAEISPQWPSFDQSQRNPIFYFFGFLHNVLIIA
jgi:hypothetical protein